MGSAEEEDDGHGPSAFPRQVSASPRSDVAVLLRGRCRWGSRQLPSIPSVLRVSGGVCEPQRPFERRVRPLLCPKTPAALRATWLLVFGLPGRLAIPHGGCGARRGPCRPPPRGLSRQPRPRWGAQRAARPPTRSSGSLASANGCNYPRLKSRRDREVRAAGGGQRLPAKRFRPAVNLQAWGRCSARHRRPPGLFGGTRRSPDAASAPAALPPPRRAPPARPTEVGVPGVPHAEQRRCPPPAARPRHRAGRRPHVPVPGASLDGSSLRGRGDCIN